MLVPTIACRAASDRSPPRWAASSSRPTDHTFSLSTSVPSMSNRTPAGSLVTRSMIRAAASTGHLALSSHALPHPGTSWISVLLRCGRRRPAVTGALALAEALRVRPVLVGRMAVLHEEDEENDPADDRNEADEQPPARAARIVQASHAHGESRNKQGQLENRSEEHTSELQSQSNLV